MDKIGNQLGTADATCHGHQGHRQGGAMNRKTPKPQKYTVTRSGVYKTLCPQQ